MSTYDCIPCRMVHSWQIYMVFYFIRWHNLSSVVIILSTQSRGYSDIKICSSYKINWLSPKPTFLICQICLKTICKHKWKFYLVMWLQGDALWTRGRQPFFSHGSGMWTECVKMTKLLHSSNIHPCSEFKLAVCVARCLFKWRNEPWKGLEVSLNRRTFWILLPAYLLGI